MDVTCQYKDCCLSDYLQDHCNGENEQLICFPVSNETTVKELRDGLVDNSWETDKIPEEISDESIKEAISKMFVNVSDEVFDEGLSEFEEDEEGSYFYAALRW